MLVKGSFFVLQTETPMLNYKL